MNLRLHLLAAMLSLALMGMPAQAQQPGSSNPLGAPTPTNPQAETPEQAPTATNAPVADTRPLSGAEDIGVGLRTRGRNYVLPSLQIYAYGDTNRSLITMGETGTELEGSVTGRLAVQHVSRTRQFTMDYMGGGMFYARESSLNATMHAIGLSQTFTGRRWALMLGDRASYLPESPFGFGGFGSLDTGLSGVGGAFGMNLGSLSPAFSMGQTLVSGRGYRISNVTLAQIQYNTSARSTITAAASYGLLRFEESGLIDSDHRIFTLGYDRNLNRRDSVGVTYGVSMFRFRGLPQAFDDHFVQISYGHRITGRLGFELAGGPEIDKFKSSLTDSSLRYYWNLHSALRYRWPRSDMALTYSRYTTSGSGLLLGAQTDEIRFSASRRFTRSWSGSFSPGLSRNAQLEETTSSSVHYNTYYVGGGLQRSLGRYTDVSLNYTFQGQMNKSTDAAGVSINNTLNRHVFGLAVSWHGRQLEVD
ncbi:MAG: hypothetical protein LAN62_10970 [Acidobacteriia bacterium]|nr:hypothetical protein [Terriglobia bacterium]